ncbi:MAG: CheY-like chemotaxis protein [Verrucomicrobiales bacterium]|jgi:CheY-like chemotaxis protein
MDATDSQWDELRRLLKEAEDEAMWDPEEIHAALEEANAKNISAKVVLACWESCRSQAADFGTELKALVARRKRRIFSVDDEADFSELLKMNLEKAGAYEVQVESDARVALERAKAFQPDLIILDVVMPGIHGPELAKQMRADPELTNIPIIMLTALMEGSASGGVTRDGLLYLAKPIPMKNLVHCIEEHIRKGAGEMDSGGRFDAGT